MTVSGLDLVRASLRWDAAGDRALRALDGAGWEAVMATVRRRDGQALLARRLSRLPALPVPEYVAQELHRFRLDVAIRTLAGLARLGPAIAAAGVPVMALKGLDLGTRLYGDLGARPMGDMDILVQPAHVAIMADALRAQGFRVAQVAQPPPHHLSFHAPPCRAASRWNCTGPSAPTTATAGACPCWTRSGTMPCRWRCAGCRCWPCSGTV